MSISRRTSTTLRCDIPRCRASLTWMTYVSKAIAEQTAHQSRGWRKDKTGRNICPIHPKRKEVTP